MKITKIYLISLIVIVIIGLLGFLYFKFELFKKAEPEYFLNVNISADIKEELETRIKEDYERLELFPNTYEVFIDLGNIEKRLGNASKAIEHYTRAWEIIPSNSTPWINIGNVYMNLKMYNKAEEAFIKALDINPKYKINYVNLADLYQIILTDKSDQVRGIYLEGMATIPNRFELMGDFATYLYESGDYSEALLYFNQLIEEDPDNQSYRDMVDLVNQKMEI